jgi:hypothetical protein
MGRQQLPMARTGNRRSSLRAVSRLAPLRDSPEDSVIVCRHVSPVACIVSTIALLQVYGETLPSLLPRAATT